MYFWFLKTQLTDLQGFPLNSPKQGPAPNAGRGIDVMSNLRDSVVTESMKSVCSFSYCNGTNGNLNT